MDPSAESRTISDLGAGDSRLLLNLPFPPDFMDCLRHEVAWQRMYHLSGAVPRLVAAQGEVDEAGNSEEGKNYDDGHGNGPAFPIYRHPADESPPLRPFSPTVLAIRDAVQVALTAEAGATEGVQGGNSPQLLLNHALIQLYRGGADSIAEHSDKTLDVVRDSPIVNVSLGAERVMVLRGKRAAGPGSCDGSKGEKQPPPPRAIQRVRLPHNSLFVLGPATNRRFRHGIRPDRRPESVKTAAERTNSGMRISLTFRVIGTFTTSPSPSFSTTTGENVLIWGQGATSKSRVCARPVIHGDAGETAALISAFGTENACADEFDWEGTYGRGFDGVNFVTVHRVGCVQRGRLGYDDAGFIAVCMALGEAGMRFDVVGGDGQDTAGAKAHVCYTDTNQDTFTGAAVILRHIANMTASSPLSLDSAAVASPLDILHKHEDSTLDAKADPEDNAEALSLSILPACLNALTKTPYLTGISFSIADCALWAVLWVMAQRRQSRHGRPEKVAAWAGRTIQEYYDRVGRRACAREAIELVGLCPGLH